MTPLTFTAKIETRRCLKRSRALISDRRHWGQAFLAVDDHGLPTPYKSPHAVRFCAIGALRRVDGPQMGRAERYLEEAAYMLFEATVVGVNDGRGHPDVLRMYDAAIAQVRLPNRILKRRR